MEQKLRIQVTFHKDIIGIIKLEGELTLMADDADLFSREVRAYTKMGIYRYVLDLNNLEYIDSTGISVIMQLVSNALKNSASICLICEQPQILRILAISNVDKFVHFVKTVDEGINYYIGKDGGKKPF